MKNKSAVKFLLPLMALLTLTTWISSGVSLLLGVLVALVFGNPYADQTKKLTHKFLSLAVMGLGAGMNLTIIGKVGLHGIGYTVIGILSAFLFGIFIGKILNIDKNTSTLITVGTAICGGSAIAAVAPVIKAKSEEVSVSLGIVFVLNACALFIFPTIGHHFNLSENQFGLWSALAIHDTSSVVGATLQYGAHALEVGTTVKLARAMWIIPVAMLVGMLRSSETSGEVSGQKAKKPWFILGFILAATIVTFFPSLQPLGHKIEFIAKKLMVLTLFLIGANLTRETIKNVGIKPFIQGLLLWAIMATGTFTSIYLNWIN